MTSLHRRSLLAVAILITSGALIGGLTAAAQSPTIGTGKQAVPITAVVTETAIVAYTPTPSPTLDISPTPYPSLTPSPTYIPPTKFPRPTVDLNTNLLGKNEDEIKRFLSNAPKTLGTLSLNANPEQGEPVSPSIVFTNTDGYPYQTTLYFLPSVQEAYEDYLVLAGGITDGQLTAVGDEALIAPHGPSELALMRYRNVVVIVFRTPPYFRPSQTPVPLTSDQMTAVLKDLVDYLAKQ